MSSHESKTQSVVRLTEREDMITGYGFRFAQSLVNIAKDDNLVLIWSAIPCTGGSPWQNISRLFPGGEERIQGHLRILKALSKKLAMFVEWLNYIGTRWRICIEWPGIVLIGIGDRFDHA